MHPIMEMVAGIWNSIEFASIPEVAFLYTRGNPILYGEQQFYYWSILDKKIIKICIHPKKFLRWTKKT